MANNTTVNKVVINNQTVLDLTDTTAETDKVLDGEIFYTASGSRAVGTYVDSDTIPSVQCETAAGTAAKVGLCTNFTLRENTYLHFNIRYSNSYNGAITMNVNGTGAKPVHINGNASSSSNNTLPAGSYIAFYDGTKWSFRTDSSIPADISGKAYNVRGVVDIENGGTGASTLEGAQEALGIAGVPTFLKTSVSASSSKAFNTTASSRFVIFGMATTSSANFLYMVSVYATNANAVVAPVLSSSSVTYTMANGVFTLTNSSSAVLRLHILIFNGTVTEAS